MTQLTGLDALFLHLETEDMPMHVGSLHLYEVPARIRRDFVERVRRHLAGRLHLCPTFTRRLAPTPMGLAPPAWIDDPAVDLEYHVRRVDLPAPGSREQLDECVAELHSRPLDRTRPLWEFHLIHGLPKGGVAFYAKVHHAAVDGQAGVALARAMLDTSPHPRAVPPPPQADPAPLPPPAVRLGAAIANQFRQSGRLLGRLPGLARAGSRFAGSLLAERLSQLISGGADDPSQPPLLAPRTPFNTTIDRSRAFACVAVPIADAKRITAALGGTMNDVVLALCSGALRAWLDERGELPGQPLLAAVPMSLRAEGDTAQNTQATMVRIGLATGVADPLERYVAIREASESMKRTMQAVRSELPTDFPSFWLPWLLPGAAGLAGRARLADRLRLPANLVISNVPGPRMPLYLAGARMLSYEPASIVTHGLALNITAMSYLDTIHIGMVACRRAVPDLPRLAELLEAAHRELLALASEDG
ncbi:WS/DGAT/MGAT family O-acyltransferase [Quisquiliibacterium transsilvanicum]|uniref:diacylglycerol O-acyltransferase n=1 Tax=Quisquiliibacterium transsilvanicum TaxID=1549638 RepID=A0A7W8M866_9BURK|nr:wax ester/triacylglycerol synthase family O-acyltransferase [Quisquiliibacterium transsilvanicum]MBB5270940.1 WS/DGAT/MGAT family acyltransferase [Quisquiliibacterium transsilvanicum]